MGEFADKDFKFQRVRWKGTGEWEQIRACPEQYGGQPS